MTDAPERIWLTADNPDHRPFVTQGPLAAPPRTEYVRADLLQEVEAERDNLRQTARDAMNCAIDAAGGSAEAWARQAVAFYRLRVACGLILPSDRAALGIGGEQ